MSSLKKLVFRGAFWTLINYGGSQVLRLGGNLLLTRLLFPEFFGLMALVNIFIMGLALFSDVGIGVSVIQNKQGDQPSFFHTAWTIQVIRGIGLWFICLLLAYPMSQFYGEPQLAWLIPVVGITTILEGFSSAAIFLLERRLAVKKLAIMQLVAQLIQVTVMLIWAVFSPTLWALVGGGLVASVVKLIWSHHLIPGHTDRFAWEQEVVQEIFTLGRWVFISTAFTFMAEQADRLLLGKLFPLDLLGVYGVALMMSDVPRQVAVSMSGKVIFPTVSKMTDIPRHELRAKILHHRKFLLLLLVFGMAILVSFGDFLILFLYDERYADAAWMLPILALGIWPRLLCATIEASLVAIGKVHYSAIGNFTRLTFTVVGILVGFAWLGNFGAILAVALNDLVYYLVVNYGLYRERIGCFTQDVKATVLLSIGLLVAGIGRILFGLGLPLDGVL
ncbi:MAG: hypothetical protein Kow00121_48440 [Elainellaceae cyanobacterium]